MKKIIKQQKGLHKDSNLSFSPALLRSTYSGWDSFFNSERQVSDDFMAERVQPVNQKRELI
ncbi:AbrB/MazE/SpoVT family DNA-binding domain-containing protein [Salinimonas lutimaris]|uniref:hypothetical protein n=1 Tax=Salinimonas lutimaris TaxID=914153 RepID=UPI0010BF936C|nr:hypothetical protein [Salinimonas lutimaris]